MKWLDFSYYRAKLYLDTQPDGRYLVAVPMQSEMPLPVQKAFLSMGFAELQSGVFRALATEVVTQRLFEAKHSRLITVDPEVVRWQDPSLVATPTPQEQPLENATLNVLDQPSGDNNGSINDDRIGEAALERVLPQSLSGDDQERRIGEGSGGGGSAHADGNEDLDAIRDNGGVGVGGVEGLIHSDPAERRFPGDAVSSTVTQQPLEYTALPEGNVDSATASTRMTYGQRLASNMAAVRLVKQLEGEGRLPNAEELQVLSGFTGWGALKNVFAINPSQKQEREAYAELSALLTKDELYWANNGILAQHFTPPEMIAGIYDGLTYMGFKGGHVIEPNYGTGRFIDGMPDALKAKTQWYGAEIDPIPAKIAAFLHPTAKLLVGQGYQEAEFQNDRFDLVIGNPPFGDERITDNAPIRAAIDGFRIHNYCIAKSAMHAKPGGMLAFVVTHRFLDAKDDEARRLLAEDFNLVTAIRLPNTAFAEAAGTEVTTDIVFFQKRTPDQAPDNGAWLKPDGKLLDENNQSITLNQFFVENPSLLLGRPAMDGTLYGGPRGADGDTQQFTLHPFENAAPLRQQISDAITSNPALQGILGPASVVRDTIALNKTDVAIGGFFLDEEGEAWMREEDLHRNPQYVRLTPTLLWTEKSPLNHSRLERIKGMLQLRQQTYALIDAERNDQSDIEVLRDQLNQDYDTFVTRYGYINDPANATLMARDVKIEFGLEKNYRSAITGAKAKKRHLDQVNAHAEKADILVQRVFFPTAEVLFASNARDGYAVSLSEKGRLDLDFISTITGLPMESITDSLSGGEDPLIYRDPESGSWVQEDVYLSGNVKKKYRIALAAGEGYQHNAAALERVLPADIAPEQIFIDLGQTWISESFYEEFLEDLGVSSPSISIIHQLGSVTVTRSGVIRQTALSDELQNQDYTVTELFNHVANKRNLVAYDGSGDSRTINYQRTRELSIIARKMRLLFADWTLADANRAQSLATVYNESQNTSIARQFNGVHLRTVGASPTVSLRDSQRNVAWRMIQSDRVLLDHVVGSGKTYSLIAGIMERKRLGLSNKPCLVVPNHLVKVWNNEFLRLYPAASLLAATEKDFEKKNRRAMFSRMATGQYDAIIMGHSSFKFIPVSKESEITFLLDETEQLKQAMKQAEDNGDKRGARALANRLAKRREKVASLRRGRKDDVVTFESIGIDYLAVDESHEFKNLEYASSIQRVSGMGNPNGSQKAMDLLLKVRLIQAKGGGVAFATGTPVSNSLVEMYAIMRYLNPEGLAERRLASFDAWAKTYALIESRIEYTATQQLKERSVMASFNNIPEMLQLYTDFADVLTMEDLKALYVNQIQRQNALNHTTLREAFPVPRVVGGGRQLNIAPANERQLAYMDYLVERALLIEEQAKKGDLDPTVDNLLWVYSDAKKAALDIRIVDPLAYDYEDNKANRAANEIESRYWQWHDDKGTQVVFCDLSTPSALAEKSAMALLKDLLAHLETEGETVKNAIEALPTYLAKWDYLKHKIQEELDDDIDDRRRESLERILMDTDSEIGVFITADTGFSVYDALKQRLMAKGIPEKEIQFIHHYPKGADKKELFDQVNAGNVRVLIGSTAKMGAGTNIQQRLVALHHIDASMHNRPSDIEQREGRIIRQGNLFYERDPDGFEVDIIAYSTEKTFDAVSWQSLARKASMLESFRKGGRSIEENNSDSASYMEFMAETTGNPIFKEKMQLESRIEELEADERRIKAQLATADRLLSTQDDKLARLNNRLSQCQTLMQDLVNEGQIVYRYRHYQRDFDAVYAEQQRLFQESSVAYEKSLKHYKRELATWSNATAEDRGAKPKKPVQPVKVTPFCDAMLKASEEIQFLDKVIQEAKVQDVYSSPIRFSVGDHYFTVKRSLDLEGKNHFLVTDDYDLIGNTIFERVSINQLVNTIRMTLKGEPYKQRFASTQLSKSRLEDDIAVANRLKESVTFSESDALAVCRERYQLVNETVNAIESHERARRLSGENPYINGDFKRFKHPPEVTLADGNDVEDFALSL